MIQLHGIMGDGMPCAKKRIKPPAFPSEKRRQKAGFFRIAKPINALCRHRIRL
jgi:hypothetical protein